jgi:hypothetical protein
MKREDYLLRMIAQLGLVLAHIRRKLIQGKNVEAGEELAQASVKGGIDLQFLIALDETSLRPLLTTGGEFDRPKCAFFAEILYLEWRRQLAMQQPDRATRCAQRALLLLAIAYEGIVMDDATRERVSELKGEVDPSELHDKGE